MSAPGSRRGGRRTVLDLEPVPVPAAPYAWISAWYVERARQLSISVSADGPDGWHLSIAGRHRYPTWDEIVLIRYRLVPDEVTMAMLLPSKSEWVNAHEYCFHLHQVPV